MGCCLQVREAAITTLVDVYRHVGERVRADLAKRGLPAARWVITVIVKHEFDSACVPACLCICVGTYTLFSRDVLLWSLRPSVCPRPHHAPFCPSHGHRFRAQCWLTRGGIGGRVQIAHKDIRVGGVKWFEQSMCSCRLKRESIGWFHPFLVVPVANVCWLLRMSLVSVNADWGHVSCVVHIKAWLFPL